MSFSPQQRSGRWLIRGIVSGLILWLLPGCVNRLFYYPDRNSYREPASMGKTVEEVFFPSGDGVRLHGWYVRSPQQPATGTIVHFHGNAQNLTAHSSFVDWLPNAGFNLLLFDYRGYGKSEGHPSRKGLYLDGVAALQFVRTLPGVDTNRIAVIGQSLGGATALAVAGRNPGLTGRALVIDSSFYSYRSIVRDKIKMIPLLSLLRVPLSWILITDAYGPSAHLGELSPTAVLYLHGTADRVIPIEHAHRLYKKTSEPKQLLVVEGGQHISGMMQQREQTIPVITQFLTEAFDGNH